MGFLLKLVAPTVQDKINTWLKTRALVIPQAKRSALDAKIAAATGGRVSAADAEAIIQLTQATVQEVAVSTVSTIL